MRAYTCELVKKDDQSMDLGAVVQRRASKELLDRGGWPVNPEQEQLRDAWIDSDNTAEEKRLAR